VHDQRVGKAAGKAVLLDKQTSSLRERSFRAMFDCQYIPAGDIAKPKVTVRYVRNFSKSRWGGQGAGEGKRAGEKRRTRIQAESNNPGTAAARCEIRKLLRIDLRHPAAELA
jgi:hypothetical protein